MLWAEDLGYNGGSEQIDDQVCWNLPAFSQFTGNLLQFQESKKA